MNVFDAAHVLYRHLDVQVSERAELAAITAGKRDSSATNRFRILGSAQYVGRIT